MTSQVEEEQRQRDDAREQYMTSEKRCNILQNEHSEIMTDLEQVGL